MKFSYNEATALVIKALMDGDEITALNGGKFLTTRVANHICALREDGLQIETETIRTVNKKWYGRYRLIDSEENYRRAIELLEHIEAKLYDEVGCDA